MATNSSGVMSSLGANVQGARSSFIVAPINFIAKILTVRAVVDRHVAHLWRADLAVGRVVKVLFGVLQFGGDWPVRAAPDGYAGG